MIKLIKPTKALPTVAPMNASRVLIAIKIGPAWSFPNNPATASENK